MRAWSLALSLLAALPSAAEALRRDASPRDWPADYWEDDARYPSWSTYAETSRAKGRTDVEDWSPESRVLLYPEKKLAFCYIEKNACTQFNKLFNHLNGMPDQVETWWQSNVPALGYHLNDLSRSKGWKWAVFLRDPLLRYLSAWGSKCVQKEDDGWNCVPQGSFSPAADVQDFEAQVLANEKNPGPMADNPHWALQQSFCGGLRNVSGYDFVGHLRGDVNAQVHAMLKMVGAPSDRVDQLFPPSSNKVAGHHSSLDPETYYRSNATRAAVRQMFADDYRLPGL